MTQRSIDREPAAYRAQPRELRLVFRGELARTPQQEPPSESHKERGVLGLVNLVEEVAQRLVHVLRDDGTME